MVATGTVSAQSFVTTSDKLLKTNVTSLEERSRRLLELRGVSYRWNQEAFPERWFDNATHFGFLAQDVEAVFPEIVRVDDAGWRSIQVDSFEPLIVEVLRDMRRVLADLAVQNAAFVRESAFLAQKISALERQDGVLAQKLDDVQREVDECRASVPPTGPLAEELLDYLRRAPDPPASGTPQARPR
ncbi:hypothetical protein M885DRAFT_574810 [Pelagophyceae sp. CCMP2097]|nr:hypothetical protein M885DRAFT_574810 [Pelagophyceae sp. CCMP2097]